MNYFNNFYLYVDDQREPLMEYDYWAKSYNEAVSALKTYHSPSHTALLLDLDHDLGEEKTGYDIAKWCIENNITGIFRVHSMNPVGRKNIEELLTHYGWTEIF